jgi:chloride channel 7
LLKKKAFVPTPVPTGTDAFKLFFAGDFAKRGSGNGDKIEDLQFTEEEMEMFLDLHPFTNASPYTVAETMSLAKALILFREVGLRHLLVIPKISGVRNSILAFCFLKCLLVAYTNLRHFTSCCSALDIN